MVLVLMGFLASLLAYLKSEQTHLVVNSRMTEWMEKADQASDAAGYQRGVADQEGSKRRVIADAATAAALVLKVAEDKALKKEN